MKLVIAFIGMGMIAGSFAKALRKSPRVDRILACDTSKIALTQALTEGVIDEAISFDGVAQADVIVLAAPVQAFYGIAEKLANISLKNNVVITDVGSTKRSVLQAFENSFGYVPDYFIPAHPIAGREQSGVQAAQEDLFKNKKVIITPLTHSDNRALGIVSQLWLATGAMITCMSIREHDEILGATSHLPHVLAYLLVDMLDQDLHHDEIFDYSAGGFRDFTRIASSSPIMWRDVCLNNTVVIGKLLETYRQRIAQFESLIRDNQGEEIEKIFTRAKAARDAHYQKETHL